MFELALASTGLSAEQVVHIGDSLSSDIEGAGALGIRTLWINKGKKKVPEGVVSINNLLEIFDKVEFEY